MSEGTGKHSHQRYQSLLIIHLALFAKYASTTLALSFFDNYSRRDILKKASAATSIAFSITQPISASADTVLLPGGSAAFNPQIVGEWNNMPAMLQTKLGKSRILADELSPLSQPLLGDQELYYPPFLFGAWNVTATLKQKIYPYGTQYVPSYSLIEGSPRNRNEQVGNTCQYEVHYFSTIADTLANQATVNLGLGVPKTKIIQDRAFNAVSISKSYKQLLPVEDVVWDYSKDPSRVQLNVAPGALSEDMQPLGPRRTEIFLTARQSDQLDENVFCSAERSRSVTLLTRNGIVSDSVSSSFAIL